MSVTLSVIGIMPDTDPTFQKMRDVAVACDKADIDLPSDAQKYFDDRDANPYHPETALEVEVPVREWHSEGGDGFEIEVAAIPAGIKTLRFQRS